MDNNGRFILVFSYLKKNKYVSGVRDLANKIDVSPSMITSIITGRSGIGERVLTKLCEKFEFINATWILTGRGKMILDDVDSYNYQPEISYSKIEITKELKEVEKKIKNLLSKLQD